MGHGGLSLFLQHNVRRQGNSRFAAHPGMRAAGTREERESVERFEGYIWLVSATHIRQPAGKAGEKGREST